MDWIKQNYEKLLLALFGLFALAVGSLLSLKAFSSGEAAEAAVAGKEKSELGQDKSADVQKTLADLTSFDGKPIWSSVKMGEHRSARLFTAAPTVEKAGVPEAIALLDDAAPNIREGVPNWWLYENGLDLTRDDVLSMDSDNDRFTNKEEFEGKSNPRDSASSPPFYAKLALVEIIEVKYEIRFGGAIDNDLQIKRLVPQINGRSPGKLDYKIGDTLFEDDKRFKVSKVEDREAEVGGQKQMVKHLILEDTANPTKPVVIAEKTTFNLPTYRAKVKSLLSGAEDTKAEGEELTFPEFPGIKINLEKISTDAVEINYAEPGRPQGKAQLKRAN
jgi:hypothetical protein